MLSRAEPGVEDHGRANEGANDQIVTHEAVHRVDGPAHRKHCGSVSTKLNDPAHQMAIGQGEKDAFSSENNGQFQAGVVGDEANRYQEEALRQISVRAKLISGKTPP